MQRWKERSEAKLSSDYHMGTVACVYLHTHAHAHTHTEEEEEEMSY